jgi:hypothetical protein
VRGCDAERKFEEVEDMNLGKGDKKKKSEKEKEYYETILDILFLFGYTPLVIFYTLINSSPYCSLFFFIIGGILTSLYLILKREYKKEGISTKKMDDIQYLTRLIVEAKDENEFDRRRSLYFKTITFGICFIVGTMACWGYYSMLLLPRYGNIISMLVTIITFGFCIWYSSQTAFYRITRELEEQKFGEEVKEEKRKD